MEEKWGYGERTTIARRAGVTRQFIGGLFRRRYNASEEVAERIAKAALSIGVSIRPEDLRDTQRANSPLFSE